MCMTQQSLEQGKCLQEKTEKEPSGNPTEMFFSMEDSNSCFGRNMSIAVKAGDLNLCWRFPDVCSVSHRNWGCICLPVH